MIRHLPRVALPIALGVVALALTVVGTLLAVPAGAQPPVAAGTTWSPRDSTVFNYPLSPRKRDHYRIRNTILHAIDNSPAGSSINLTTFTFIDDHIADALLKAVRRGVSVQMLVNQKNSSVSEPLNRYRAGLKKVRQHLKRTTGKGGPSFVRICQHSCRGRFGNLHTKIYLFSQVADAQYVSMVSSANLTDFAAVGQWNHLDTVVDQATYAQWLAVFDSMRLRKPQPFRAFRTSKLDAWVFPRMGTTAADDPMIKQLAKIGCTVPGTNRRTMIRIAMYAWFDGRGTYLAKAVRQKWNQGCGVKIIYSIMNWQSIQILRNPAGRGMIPMRRDVTLNGLGDVVDYNHSKYIALNGAFNGQPAQTVWTGSMNFTQLGIRSDDVIVRLSGQRVLRDYLTNFSRVWHGPAITMPPHVNPPPTKHRKKGMTAADVHGSLARRGETLATAESLTGGRLASLLTDVAGASATYVGGVVSYATSVKEQVLGVPTEVVEANGVVSAECAQAMAEGVRRLVGADWGVATTGVAGPTEQEGKPVGTVFVGLAGPAGTSVETLSLDGDREAIRAATCDAALARLLALLQG